MSKQIRDQIYDHSLYILYDIFYGLKFYNMIHVCTEPLKGHSHNSVIYFLRTKSISFERYLFRSNDILFRSNDIYFVRTISISFQRNLISFERNLFRSNEIYFVRTKSI